VRFYSVVIPRSAGVSLLFLWAICLHAGCSEEKVVPTLPKAHPQSWMDKTSIDFHGDVVNSRGYVGCDVCHGNDFAGGRVGVSCVECHQKQVGLCTSCHGGVDNGSGAPPLGLRGEVADTTIAVGAHSVHLEGEFITDGIVCESCHHVPAFLFDSLHLGRSGNLGDIAVDSVAEITWHGFADGGGAAWDRATRSCTETYCHGNFHGGYSSNAPIWTADHQAHCGSCHDIGYDPPDLLWKHEFHLRVANLACADCHANVVDSLLNIVGLNLHVNGRVDTLARDTLPCVPCHSANPANCVICHGGRDNQTGAPPLGLRGELSANQLAVGAHTSHVEGGYIATAVACRECHIVPSTFADPGHYGTDSIAETTWGNLAGSASQWNRIAATCSKTYCHGNFAGGYASNAPIWTAPGQIDCGSCHDNGTSPADLGGRHFKHVIEENFECRRCHAATVDSLLNIIGKNRHVNGARDVVFSSGQGSFSNGTCSNLGDGCHDTENWYETARGR